MDAFVAFIILLIVISVLEKVLKAGKQKGKGTQEKTSVHTVSSCSASSARSSMR